MAIELIRLPEVARDESVLVFSNSLVRNNEVTYNPDGTPVIILRTGYSRLESVLLRENSLLNDPIEDVIIQLLRFNVKKKPREQMIAGFFRLIADLRFCSQQRGLLSMPLVHQMVA